MSVSSTFGSSDFSTKSKRKCYLRTGYIKQLSANITLIELGRSVGVGESQPRPYSRTRSILSRSDLPFDYFVSRPSLVVCFKFFTTFHTIARPITGIKVSSSISIPLVPTPSPAVDSKSKQGEWGKGNLSRFVL